MGSGMTMGSGLRVWNGRLLFVIFVLIFVLLSASLSAASPDWAAYGNQEEAWFGVSVGTAGDVNGDGFSDVIVGAYLYDNGETDEGRASLYSGSPAGLAASPAWTAESNQAGAWFGYSVGAAGDVNGDGFSDVIVGAWHYSNGESEEGRVFLYLGSPTGLSASPVWTAEGNQAGAHFGISVGTAGDVNGDGYADLVVGAWHYTNNESDEGAAFVYHGSPAGLSANPAWIAEGNQANAYLGISVGTAGDVNNDGFSDLIVGAYGYDNPQGQEGRALLYLGSPAGLAPTAAWSTESNQAGAYLGISVGTAGDVNGDGYDDAIVGTYQYSNGQIVEGKADVFHGSAAGLSSTPSRTIEGDQYAAYLGISVGTAGDVNGDGFSDIIVGSYFYDHGQTDEGAAFVYTGSAAGLSASPTWTLESNQSGSQFGVSAGTAGDVNGDGFSDVIVGAWLYYNGEIDEGGAFVYHGSASSPSLATDWGVNHDLSFEDGAPNPFSRDTELSYTLRERGPVRLGVWDVGGRQVALLAAGVQEAGRHALTWSGRDYGGTPLPAGVYFARLESSGRVAQHKIVLAR